MLAALCLSVLAPVAHADIAPPPGYVEACTVPRVQASNPGQTCVSCDAWHGGREGCEAYEAKGFIRRCKTRGASTWDEVLCKAGTPDEAPPSEEPSPEREAEAAAPAAGSCSVGGGPGGVAWLVVVGMLAVRRRG